MKKWQMIEDGLSLNGTGDIWTIDCDSAHKAVRAAELCWCSLTAGEREKTLILAALVDDEDNSSCCVAWDSREFVQAEKAVESFREAIEAGMSAAIYANLGYTYGGEVIWCKEYADSNSWTVYQSASIVNLTQELANRRDLRADLLTADEVYSLFRELRSVRQ